MATTTMVHGFSLPGLLPTTRYHSQSRPQKLVAVQQWPRRGGVIIKSRRARFNNPEALIDDLEKASRK